MKITNEWLLQWQTPNGGYNKRQLTLLGVPWPPKRGWKRDLLDFYISDEVARAFEFASGRHGLCDPIEAGQVGGDEQRVGREAR